MNHYTVIITKFSCKSRL